MRSRLWLLLIAALAVTLAACGGANGGSAQQDEGHGDGGHATAEEAPAPVEGAPEVAVTAVDIDFEPATLELSAGEPTNVVVTNEGETLHDFTLEEADVHLNLEPGETKSAALVVDEPGDYTAVCTVPGHADAGMTIDVTVS